VPRPREIRQVAHRPTVRAFKPAGVPFRELETLTLALDELEALRLADREGLYHELAAERMGVSRVTFGRILAAARSKVAEALVDGKAIAIGEGPVRFAEGDENGCPVHGGPRRRGRACRCEGAEEQPAPGEATEAADARSRR
jgi:predicted DNA-binding protein (UPF0251 family)